MADVYATNAANGYNTDPVVFTESAKVYGRRRVINDEYELAALSADDYILIGQVTPGTVILPQSVITHDALGAGTTLKLLVRDVNDGTEVDIVPAEATTSAGNILASDAAAIATIPYTVLTQSWLALKLEGGAGTGTVKTSIEISVD